MTTWPQQPVDNVQVPQTVGLSPEVAFNLVGQSGLAPMFQAQPVPGEPLPGVPTQWGQAPASFAGMAPSAQQPPAQIIAQSPIAGTWVPRGSVVYMEWAEAGPPPKKSSPVGWIILALLGLLILGGLIFALTSGGDSTPEPSKSPNPTKTVTQTPSPQPTETITETATATATQTSTSTETATATVTASP